jgi:hypothetical protein
MDVVLSGFVSFEALFVFLRCFVVELVSFTFCVVLSETKRELTEVDHFRVGLPFSIILTLIFVAFFIESRIRIRRGLYPYTSERVRRSHGFLRWAFIVSATFILHSILLCNPTSFDSSSTGIPRFSPGFEKCVILCFFLNSHFS